MYKRKTSVPDAIFRLSHPFLSLSMYREREIKIGNSINRCKKKKPSYTRKPLSQSIIVQKVVPFFWKTKSFCIQWETCNCNILYLYASGQVSTKKKGNEIYAKKKKLSLLFTLNLQLSCHIGLSNNKGLSKTIYFNT